MRSSKYNFKMQESKKEAGAELREGKRRPQTNLSSFESCSFVDTEMVERLLGKSVSSANSLERKCMVHSLNKRIYFQCLLGTETHADRAEKRETSTGSRAPGPQMPTIQGEGRARSFVH